MSYSNAPIVNKARPRRRRPPPIRRRFHLISSRIQPCHRKVASPATRLSGVDWERFKTRTMSERVNARLKDKFGASQIRVRGAAKVMGHLMFLILVLTGVQGPPRLSFPN